MQNSMFINYVRDIKVTDLVKGLVVLTWTTFMNKFILR